MELTRRDAVAALAAIGVTGGLALGADRLQQSSGDGTDGARPDDEQVRQRLVAVAATVYPSEVDGVAEFVEAFLDGRLDGSAHADGIRETVATLDDLARSWHGHPLVELSVEERDQLLREVGADTADADPAGTTSERVRYYVVNELLLALYASPTGGKLVGIENPQGHAGGTESYTQGPR